jgi:hypothetical protein
MPFKIPQRQTTAEIPARLLVELKAVPADSMADVEIPCPVCGVITEVIHGRKRQACTFASNPADPWRCMVCSHHEECHKTS